MQNIAEVSAIIDELEIKIEEYSDRTLWQRSNTTDWFTFIIDKGPKIVASWRELAGLIGLTKGDQLLELIAKWESIQALMQNQDVMQLAMKYSKKNAAPQKSEDGEDNN
jgi:hypothetical protein